MLCRCALSEAASPTGTIWAWGYNVDGELGNGTNTDSNIPVQVSLPSGVTMTNIAAGDGDCLALASNGTVWAWGDNSAGELGNGTNTDSDIPVKVSMPSGVTITNIAAGGTTVWPSRLNGTVWAWGDPQFGEPDNWINIDRSNIPVQVSLPSGVTITNLAGGGVRQFGARV